MECIVSHRGHWGRRLQPTSSIITDAKIGRFKPMRFGYARMTSAQSWSRRHHRVWADVILADFQRVISRHLQDISTYLSYTAHRVLRTIFMQKSKPTSSVSPVCCLVSIGARLFVVNGVCMVDSNGHCRHNNRVEYINALIYELIESYCLFVAIL